MRRCAIVLAAATVILVRRVNIPWPYRTGPTNIVVVWRALPATFRQRAGDVRGLLAISGAVVTTRSFAKLILAFVDSVPLPLG